MVLPGHIKKVGSHHCYSLFQWQQKVLLSSLSILFLDLYIMYSKVGSSKISSANAHICRRDDFCDFFGTPLFSLCFPSLKVVPTGIIKFADLRLAAPRTPKKFMDLRFALIIII
jgi:hypothetical protein